MGFTHTHTHTLIPQWRRSATSHVVDLQLAVAYLLLGRLLPRRPRLRSMWGAGLLRRLRVSQLVCIARSAWGVG